jgi:hypothetical protein
MKAFSLNHLNEVEFEQLCYDLLDELGFVNINWRKGTGLPSSPADRGRDIECELPKTDIDGSKHFEKWFVQCKHHIKGVPPEKIQGILAWATAEGPDTALIIVSNFLSNPAKDFLENYERTERPRFRIKFWERPDLEKLTLGKSRLLRKYKVVGEFPFLSILHPAHLLYMKEMKFNTLDYLFQILDDLDPEKRDDILGVVYASIIRPRSRKPVSGKETVGDLLIDEVSYDVFKRKCYQIAATNVIDERLFVSLIVNLVLQFWISVGDVTSVDEFIGRMERALAFSESKLEDAREDGKEALESMMGLIRLIQERIRNAYMITERNYELYEYFCDNVVTALLLEDIF